VIVIGLTGGIASGKSSVSEFLSELGAVVIDADKIGHEAFLPHTDIWREVVSAFGEGVLGDNNEIDRGKLADIVFRDSKALEQLNGIMHPQMYRTVKRKLEDLRTQGTGVVVLEAALLIEAEWTDLVDQVWVVVSPQSKVIDRLCNQKGFTGKEAEARIAAQTTASQRAKHADVLIENDSTLDSLRKKVEILWQKLYPEVKD
jgi:dephospho-CoA kinase